MHKVLSMGVAAILILAAVPGYAEPRSGKTSTAELAPATGEGSPSAPASSNAAAKPEPSGAPEAVLGKPEAASGNGASAPAEAPAGPEAAKPEAAKGAAEAAPSPAQAAAGAPPSQPASQEAAAPSSTPEVPPPADVSATAAPAANASPPAETATPLPAPGAPPAQDAAPDQNAAAAASPPETVPPASPVIAAVREKLAAQAGKGADAGRRAALASFYAVHPGAPLWVTAGGFTPKGQALLDEIRKADDWGLSAKAFDLPAAPASDAPPAVLADAEIAAGLAALTYTAHARGGRVLPSSLSPMLDRTPPVPDPKTVVPQLAAAEDPAAFLRAQHPRHRQFELLRQALLKARAPEPAVPEAEASRAEIPSSGPAPKPGARHPDIVLLRRRLDVPAEPEQDKEKYDAKLAEAVKTFQREKGLKAGGILNNATRRALNGPAKPASSGRGPEIERLLVNMERWRWLPDELGGLYVWDNIPEFMMSVVRKGEVIHSEKIIVGKPNTPTAVFSADMRYIVFHPEWYVPESIKAQEILPYLRGPSYDFFGFGGGADTRILQRHNLRVNIDGRPVNASQIDWNYVNPRRVGFTQPPGPTNVLGVVKFRFPNKHDIYMHDTPQRELFANQTRAFSHGCMRVQNPARLAEILLAEDQNMPRDQVARFLANGYNTEVALKRPIPVHVNYFTAVAGEDGKVRTFGDLYGHDRRLAAALAGRPVAVADSGGYEEVWDEPPVHQRKRRQVSSPVDDLFSGLFGN